MAFRLFNGRMKCVMTLIIQHAGEQFVGIVFVG